VMRLISTSLQDSQLIGCDRIVTAGQKNDWGKVSYGRTFALRHIFDVFH
jgi:hypothetical protein